MMTTANYDNKNREKAVQSIVKHLTKPSLLQLGQQSTLALATKCAIEIEGEIFNKYK